MTPAASDQSGRRESGHRKFDRDDLAPEEPWEGEISALLGAMPAVDPPEGFVAEALDHRPLHAGRTVAGLVLATIVVAMLSATSGLINHAAAIPEIAMLTSRHSAAQAGVAGSGAGVEAEPGDGGSQPPVSLPDTYHREATIEADDLRQAVYSREGETVSVFVQDGKVDWEALPDAGRVRIADEPAWVDEAGQVTVLEAGEQAVTIVGLPPEEVAALIAALPPDEPPGPGRSLYERSVDVATKMAEQLGFPG
jgi:hypothetical protein